MNRPTFWLCLTLVFCSFAAAEQPQAATSAPIISSVPRLVKLGGMANDASGKPMRGTVSITFALYRDQQDGAPLWLETQNVRLGASGHYSVLLGATKPNGLPAELFASGEARWLGVQVEGGKEQARVLLLSVPYALKAADAETLGGKPASAYVAYAPAASSSSAPGDESSIARTGVTASITGSGTSNFVAKWTSNTNLGNSGLFQASSGNIGLGTMVPTQRFQVNSGDVLIRGLNNFSASGNRARLFLGDTNHSIQAIFGLGTTIGTYLAPNAIFVHDKTGRVGIGISNIVPQATLDVGLAGAFGATALSVDAAPGGSAGNGMTVSADGWGAKISANFGDGLAVSSNHGTAAVLFSTDNDMIIASNSVGQVFRVDVNGKVTAAGGFNGRCLSTGTFGTSSGNACNMDLAEAYDSAQLTEPGDLVALLPSANAKVRKSAKRYDQLLLGVVSTNPGLVFDAGKTHLAGDNSQLVTRDKTVVALVGRVPVKVSMENGAIRVGDPLTSSSKLGIAMKATAAGKIIGYALASADKEGKVLAFVQPGYYAVPQLALLKAKFARLHQDNVKLFAENANLRNQFLGLAAQIKQIRGQLGRDQARSVKLVDLAER
jgi:hypothetical protein